MSDPVINLVSSAEILTTEMSRLTTAPAPESNKTGGGLVIQRSGSSNDQSSPSLSRDSSSELYTDLCGVNSQEFLTETLKTNVKSRSFLISIEKEVLSFINDDTKTSHRFPGMNTFNRMLVHRVAAFFGLDHSVEKKTPDCVTVTKCERTRIPEMKFDSVPVSPEALTHGGDNHTAEPKQVLKRSDGKGASFEKSPDRRNNSSNSQGRGDNMKKSGSYEERQVRYQHARDRIFASQASSCSDGGNDCSSGIGSNIDTTASSSLKSSQDTVSSKTWSSFESGSGSTSRRLKRQNRVIGSLDSENMTTSNHFLTPDYQSFSQENSGPGKKLAVVPKASSFGGVTECSEKAPELKASDSRLPRNNSFNATTTVTLENGGGDEAKSRKKGSEENDNGGHCEAVCPHDSASSKGQPQSNGTVPVSESTARSGLSSPTSDSQSVTTTPPDSSNQGSGILPKPLVHQSSAPDSSRTSSHQHQAPPPLTPHHQQQQYQNHRQSSWQTSHHQSFNYQQNGPRWQQRTAASDPYHQHSGSSHHPSGGGYYSGPRNRYPRAMNYSNSNNPSSAHPSSGHHHAHHNFVTGPSLPPPHAAVMSVNQATTGFWPHPDLRPNAVPVIMNAKDAQMAQQMVIQGVNLMQGQDPHWCRKKQMQPGMFIGNDGSGNAHAVANHSSPQSRGLSNGTHYQSGHRNQNANTATPASYHPGRHPQQQSSGLTMSVPPAVYYVNTAMPGASAPASMSPQQFVMLSPRLPANMSYTNSATGGNGSIASHYANHQSLAVAQQQQQAQQSADCAVTGIPVTMPISYTSIPGGGVAPTVAYLLPGVSAATGAPGLLPVPYAAFPGHNPLTLASSPFPSSSGGSVFPAVSFHPSPAVFSPSFPDYQILTSASSPAPTQGMSPATSGLASAAGAAVPSFGDKSPSPTSAQPQQQQQSQSSSLQTQSADATPPPLVSGPMNPHFFSGYTICAPATSLPPGAMMPPQLAVNPYCQMTGAMIPNHHSYQQQSHHQYHQPRTRNPHHSGNKSHFRSS